MKPQNYGNSMAKAKTKKPGDDTTLEQNPEARWFGEREVSPEQKTNMVLGVFDSVADRYDLMNDLMSGGLHRLWKRRFIDMVRPRPDKKLLDVAGGTGDIAFKYLEAAGPGAEVTVCDINEHMLEVGRDRAIDRGITDGVEWVTGNAESLPFEDESFDVYTIAFGLRNVTRIDTALKEACRVLKPGGRFFCLEFSKMKTPVIDKLYDVYSDIVIPRLGEKVANDRESYAYLVESIRKFPKQEELRDRVAAAGFEKSRYRNMSGGIVAVHSGVKP